MASPDNPEQPQPQPASVSKPEPRQPSWLARVAHRAGAFLLPHTHVRRLGEAWVDLCCAAADGVIARGARWLPWLAHAHGLTERARQASFVLFHAPYAEMAGYLEMKDKECDTERRDAVLLRFQLQELRGRLAAREAAITELQWVSTGHDRLQERNGELVQELNRMTGDHKAALAGRDDEILRLGLRSDKLKGDLAHAAEEKCRVVSEKDAEIAKLRESLKTAKIELAHARSREGDKPRERRASSSHH